MITLKGPQPSDFFQEDAANYKSKPSKVEQAYIKYYEKGAIERSEDFLSDPQWWTDKWEELTDEFFPQHYTKEFPTEITGAVHGGLGTGIQSYMIELLPIINAKGEPITYPEERLVSNFLRFNQKTYILKDHLLEILPIESMDFVLNTTIEETK